MCLVLCQGSDAHGREPEDGMLTLKECVAWVLLLSGYPFYSILSLKFLYEDSVLINDVDQKVAKKKKKKPTYWKIDFFWSIDLSCDQNRHTQHFSLHILYSASCANALPQTSGIALLWFTTDFCKGYLGSNVCYFFSSPKITFSVGMLGFKQSTGAVLNCLDEVGWSF